MVCNHADLYSQTPEINQEELANTSLISPKGRKQQVPSSSKLPPAPGQRERADHPDLLNRGRGRGAQSQWLVQFLGSAENCSEAKLKSKLR